MNLLYVKIISGIVFVLGIFYAGWHLRDMDFMAYKKEVESVAKAQEEKVKSIRSQQELVTKGIENEYNAKLAAIRNYYSTGMHNNSSSSLSHIPKSTISIDGKTTNLELACAYTTQQLVSLQSWINEQISIK